MDRRAKILATVFGACLVYLVASSFAYPRWIEPLLTVDERIAEREKELEKLKDEEEKVLQAKLAYRDYLDRMGSLDELKVQNSLRERLNKLIAKHKLEGANTSPSRPNTDRKTKFTTMHVTVTGAGTLEAAVSFLRDVYELPYLMRVGNVSVYPGSSRKSKKKSQVNLRLPIEIMVLPQQRIMERRFVDADLVQPELLVRHEGRDYSLMWTGRPFSEVRQLEPLVAKAGSDIRVEQGQRASLGGGAKGGDGEYACTWSPAEGLDDATKCTPKVDTSVPGAITYTVTVRDGSENSDTATVTVTVTEEREKIADEAKDDELVEDVKPVPTKERWKDRKSRSIRMTLLHRSGDVRNHEVMVYNSKTKKNDYYVVGDDFDGGELVYVHPRGGIVRRQDEYFLYPIGEKMNTDFKAEDTEDYPVLSDLAVRVREALEVPPEEPEEPEEAGKAEETEEKEEVAEVDVEVEAVEPTESTAKQATAPAEPAQMKSNAKTPVVSGKAPAKDTEAGPAPVKVGKKDSAPAAADTKEAKSSADKPVKASDRKKSPAGSKAKAKTKGKGRKGRRRTESRKPQKSRIAPPRKP
ncbi:MAG: hypothetical protein JSU63_02590 [Phycisphaerales bacterium]|nr:MAG: hypothetical protein JSU63_02590 [Phycisphaerales bacterium]